MIYLLGFFYFPQFRNHNIVHIFAEGYEALTANSKQTGGPIPILVYR